MTWDHRRAIDPLLATQAMFAAQHPGIEIEWSSRPLHGFEFTPVAELARDYDALFGAIEERYQRLDGLLHNAGLLGQLAPVEHYDVPTWCRVMQVNVTAAFVLTQILLPLLKRSSDGSILFTASGVGRHTWKRAVAGNSPFFRAARKSR